MREFTLGIIGGCLSHQAGVRRSDLFHQRLARRLEDGGRARLRVRLARAFEQEHLIRLESLFAKGPVDGILLHVRSVFVRKCSVITMRPSATEIRYYLHPFLFRPWRSGWADVENSDFAGCLLVGRRRRSAALHAEIDAGTGDPAPVPGDVPPTNAPPYDLVDRPTRVAGLVARDFLYMGGVLAGMRAWAIRDELRMVRDLHSRCTAMGIPLFVLGPSRWPDYRWHDRLCGDLDTRLRRVLREWSVPYCDIRDLTDESGSRLYLPDGVHFTAKGHAYVGNLLAGMFEPWFDAGTVPTP